MPKTKTRLMKHRYLVSQTRRVNNKGLGLLVLIGPGCAPQRNHSTHSIRFYHVSRLSTSLMKHRLPKSFSSQTLKYADGAQVY